MSIKAWQEVQNSAGCKKTNLQFDCIAYGEQSPEGSSLHAVSKLCLEGISCYPGSEQRACLAKVSAQWGRHHADTVPQRSLHGKAAPFTPPPARYHVLDSALESFTFYKLIPSSVSRVLAEAIQNAALESKVHWSLVRDTLQLFPSARNKHSCSEVRWIGSCTSLLGSPGLCVASGTQHCLIAALCPLPSSSVCPYCSSFIGI